MPGAYFPADIAAPGEEFLRWLWVIRPGKQPGGGTRWQRKSDTPQHKTRDPGRIDREPTSMSADRREVGAASTKHR